jgi:hypothetical protein
LRFRGGLGRQRGGFIGYDQLAGPAGAGGYLLVGGHDRDQHPVSDRHRPVL